MGLAFLGMPPNTLVIIEVVEYESNEAMATAQYTVALAGQPVPTTSLFNLTCVDTDESIH
jgi:hypothetical protein